MEAVSPQSARQSSRQGRISLSGHDLLVRFRYSKRLFAAIKKVRGASYDKEGKFWKVPLKSFDLLTSSQDFGPSHFEYDFEPEEIENVIAQYAKSLTEARERYQRNPFEVQAGDIELVDPDVVFTLTPDGTALRAVVKRGSRVKGRLEKVRAVHFIKKESSYFFPVEELAAFLKSLRSTKYNFAVEAQAGMALRFGSELRKSIQDQAEQSVNEESLQAALLSPYIKLADQSGETIFCFSGWTSEQLRHCFGTSSNFHERRKRATQLGSDEVQDLLYRAALSGIRVWMTSDVQEYLEMLRGKYAQEFRSELSEFDDRVLGVYAPEACWVCDSTGMGGLLLEESYLEKMQAALTPELKAHSAHLGQIGISDRIFIRVRDSKLLSFLSETVKILSDLGLQSHRSASFAQHCQGLLAREELRRRRAFYQEQADLSPELKNNELETKLFPHQRVAVSWLLEMPFSILGDDMGLGKTLSALAAFDELNSREESELLLVICPNSLVLNWLRESQQWVSHLSAHAFPTQKKARREFLDSVAKGNITPDILIVNYESARLDYVHPELTKLVRSRKTFLCLDESQRVKNSQSKTFQALEPIAQQSRRRLLLTGTPTPKDISDIWAQMKLLDNGERFGDNYYSWLGTVADLGNKWSEWAINRFIPEKVEETIARVHEVLLRRKKESVLSLPPKLFSRRDLELKGDQLKRYNEIRKELLLRVRSVSGKEFQRSIESILEEYLRAVQIASNPRLVDEEWKGDPVKFVELDEIIREVVAEGDQKIVLWTNFRKNVDELTERYADHGSAAYSGDVPVDERAEIIKKFQDPESDLRVLVAIPAAGGVGITLTAARTAVYLDKTWNAEHWLQSIDRIHRIGQNGTVSIISLHASQVDVLISRSLSAKQRAQDALMSESTQLDEGYPSQAELIQALMS